MILLGRKEEKEKRERRKSLVDKGVFSWEGYLNEKIETLDGH